MKPAAFTYLRPKGVDDVIALLAGFGDDAKIIAGGQSLVPILNFRLNRFKYLIDVAGLPDLRGIRFEDGDLVIGSATTYREIEFSPLVATHAPLLARATKFVAHLPIRTRGTIGGSIANFDPSAEYPAVLLALSARVVVKGPDGSRTIPADEFFVGLFTTALEPSELIVEVRIPSSTPDQRFGFDEYAKRPGDLAIIGITAAVELRDETVTCARLAVFGGANGAVRMPAVEQALANEPFSRELIESAAQNARDGDFQSDLQATAEMRGHLAVSLTRRALIGALDMRDTAA